MSKCTVCTHPRKAEIERDRLNGDKLAVIQERYGLTRRQVQYHFFHHFKGDKPDASVPELTDRLNRLVDNAEKLITDSDLATFGQKTKAVTALNGVLRLALQTAGQLKQLAPAQSAAANVTDTREYRELVAKVNEATVCPACREALKRVL